MNSINRFLSLLAPERKAIVYIYLYALFSSAVLLSLPLGIQAIINQLEAQQVSSSWAILIAVVIVGILFSGGLQMMQLYLTEHIQRRIFTRSAFEFAFRVPRIKLQAILQHHAPELVNRFFDTLTLQKGISKILIDLSTSSLQIVFGLILLSLYHPVFIAFGAVLIFILFLIIRFTGPLGLSTSLQESKYKYEVAHWLEELARTMDTFKLSGCSNLPMTKTNALTTKYLGARKNHFRVLIYQFGSFVVFKTVVTGGLLILGSILVVNQQINIGQFVASEIVIILIMESVQKLIVSMETAYDVLTSVEKIGYVTDLELEKEAGSQKISQISCDTGYSISLRKLSFRYREDSKYIIKDIDLDIPASGSLCISGYNGAGKTTLIQLIAGLYDHYEGTIVYHGLPMKNLDVNDLHMQIGDTLSQQSLFYGTLEENISMGRDGISLQKVINTSNLVGLSHLIQDLPQGYDTVIRPEGKDFSRSTVRRILLARGIVTDPKVLLLDQALFRFEYQDKIKLIKWLTSSERPWTLITVSNDADIARYCEQVLVLENGQIKSLGNFDEITQDSSIRKIFAV